MNSIFFKQIILRGKHVQSTWDNADRHYPGSKRSGVAILRGKHVQSTWYYVAAFFIPVIVIAFGFGIRGIAPFGKNSLMAIDAWGQYFPMLRETRRAFRSGRWYSFSGGLGFSVIAQSAYYTNSPLWLLLYLLPFDITPAAVDIIVWLRFGLSGLTFSIWLFETYKEKNMGCVAISTAYALSGYSLAFINQFMWADAVWLLPLVILGIERLYNRRKPLLYVVSLAVTIFSNFYIAFMVCMFCALWFIAVAIVRWKGLRSFCSAAVCFFRSSLAAGAVNLPVLIAVARAISKTKAAGIVFDWIPVWYVSWGEIGQRFLPFQHASLVYGAPNLYLGILCAGLVIPAALSRRSSAKSKLTFGGIAAFLLLSFNLNILDYIWHGFHFPNQLPARQSFFLIFMMLTASYMGLQSLNRVLHKEKIRLIIPLLIAAEVSANCLFSFYTDVKIMNDSMLALEEDIAALSEYIMPDYEEGEFYRTELAIPRDNGGMLYGYNGISYYSSTMSAKAYDFFIRMGLPIYARNVSTRYEPNAVLNSLFGVRYLISLTGDTDEFSRVKANAGDLYLIENKTALPLAFVADSAVTEIESGLSGTALQYELVSKAAGYESITADDGTLQTDKFYQAVALLKENGMKLMTFGSRKICGTVDAHKDGILMITLSCDDITVYINGRKAEKIEILGYMCGVAVEEGESVVEIVTEFFSENLH